MSAREQRIEVFRDTMDWIETDPDLSASIGPAEVKTAVYYEDDYPSFEANREKNTEITVTKHRSYEAAMLLHKEFPNKKIAVMNFANAFHAGGGVTMGAGAQEECLCRTSTLYPLIHRITLRDTFYQHHRDLNTPKASDSLIYTEGVIICKSDEDLPKRLDKSDWVRVDVMTIAAPDLRISPNKYAALAGNGTGMNNAELFGYHVKRAIHMLTVAAARKADILVLGAFGCGAFQNDPQVVARAYKTALTEFPKVFDRIEFAVYCRPGDPANYNAFRKTFADPEKPSAGAGSHTIEDFAEKWIEKFSDPDINYVQLVDHFMADDCKALGFCMDCGKSFEDKFGKASFDVTALKRVLPDVTDVNLLGSAIYSRWRYFNHWAYDASEILEPENREWFTTALHQLMKLACNTYADQDQ